MAYRNIMVHVDGSAAGGRRVDAAVALATRFNCPLTGAFLRSTRLPSYMVSEGITPMSQDVLDGYFAERMQGVERASNRAREVFRAHLGRDPITTRWLDIDGETADQLIECAQHHDLTILPPEIMPAFGDSLIPAARVGMASGGPVLVLKHGGYRIPFGKKILVAWNGSREAMRAIRDAWPLLETAEEVHILKVAHPGDREPDALMMRQLQDHGCPTPQLHIDLAGDTPVEDQIRLCAGRCSADLIVMGLYGHSRLRELVMGGVSRSLLADPPLPLLVSH